MPDLKTIGLSPKAVLAFLYPLLGAIVVAVATWITDGGTLDWSQIRIAAGGLLLSGLALIGAYIGQPGNVVPKDQPEV
jgi:hypothetical protein